MATTAPPPQRPRNGQRTPKFATEQPGNSFRYLYWRLSEKAFQQLCGALLRNKYNDVQCFPVGMADQGIDAISDGDVIYQVKWSSKVQQDAANWLTKAIDGEREKIERLVRERRASRYVLMTSVAGTTTASGTGSMQKLANELDKYSKQFGIPVECWWQSEIDAEVDLAPDSLKWSYQEMLAGTEAIRYLIYGSQVEGDAAQMRDTVLQVMAAQWRDDARIKFSQVELGRINLVDLFVDVRASLQAAPRNAIDQFSSVQNHRVNETLGAVEYMLKTTVPLTYLLGVPGQGKSTLGQYLSQVHRAAILPGDMLPERTPPHETVTEPKLPLRIDLSDYAAWLSGRDPFGEDELPKNPRRRKKGQRSLELFLAAFCSGLSGGRSVTVEQVQSLLARYPTLLVLDGLDEIADLELRRIVVEQIDDAASRMAGTANIRRFQVLVTARPNAASLPEPDKNIFQTLRLEPLTPELQGEFVNKWANVYDIHGADRRKLRRIFQSRVALDHIAQLADNPMQLTILLFLISRKGEAVPVSRTPLYSDYMQTLLEREVDNHQIDRDQVPRVEEVTSFLGWYMHSGVESTPNAGRMTRDDIETALLIYFRKTEAEELDVKDLFKAVSDRFWALTSKMEGTFEFAVQPVREFFAARFMAEWAGQDRRDPLPKQDVLKQLIERAYWLNTARFYAGFANPNELAGLRYGLDDALIDRRHPLQERVAVWALLLDGIFANKVPVQRDVVRLLTDDLSLRLIEHDPESSVNFPRLGRKSGGGDLTAALFDALVTEPDKPMSDTRVTILRRHAPLARKEFAEWWLPRVRSAIGTPAETPWLRIGGQFGVPRLLPRDANRLSLADPDSCDAALSAGASPDRGTAQNKALLRAVLDGWCSDTDTLSFSEAGALLRAMRPQWYLQLAEPNRDGPATPTEHFWITDSARPSRSSAWSSLLQIDKRYGTLKRAAIARAKGQKGTTEPWQNPAREIAQLHGPCWLAADIAIIGAATTGTIGSGSIDRDGEPFGANTDYGRLVIEVHRHPGEDWWVTTHDAYDDSLSRRTWALALLATASEDVVIGQLERIDAILTNVADHDFDALASSSSRLGVTRIPRRLGARTLRSLSGRTARTKLLVSHFACDLSKLDPMEPLTDADLTQLARPHPTTWPIARAITARLLDQPRPEMLGVLAMVGPRSRVQVPPGRTPTSPDVVMAILENPAIYPGSWVIAAERGHSITNSETTLDQVVLDHDWVPKVPRL